MMVDYLMQSFRERVNQMDWLSDLSRQRSIEKVNEITAHTAFPPEIFDNDYLNGLYSRVSSSEINRIVLVQALYKLRAPY